MSRTRRFSIVALLSTFLIALGISRVRHLAVDQWHRHRSGRLAVRLGSISHRDRCTARTKGITIDVVVVPISRAKARRMVQGLRNSVSLKDSDILYAIATTKRSDVFARKKGPRVTDHYGQRQLNRPRPR